MSKKVSTEELDAVVDALLLPDKKKKKGQYRKRLAQKAFMYLIDDGAKRYVRSYGGNHLDVFPKRQRKTLAKDYVEEFEQIYDNQEFDFMR